MDEKKTVIWHGGLEALLQSDAPHAPSKAAAHEAHGAAAHEALTATREISEVTASHLRRLSEQTRDAGDDASEVAKTEIFTPAPRVHDLYRPPASGTRIMGGWLAPEATHDQPSATCAVLEPDIASAKAVANAPDHAATRIHPIESLFAAKAEPERTLPVLPARELQSTKTGEDTAPTSPVTGSEPRARSMLLSSTLARALSGENRSRTLLYGVLVLVCAAGLTVRLVRARHATESPAVASATVQSAPAVASDVSVNTQVEEPPQAESGPPIVAPYGLERAAVDALARGDHALARRIYLELAGSPGAAPTFGEAARILARNAAQDAR